MEVMFHNKLSFPDISGIVFGDEVQTIGWPLYNLNSLVSKPFGDFPCSRTRGTVMHECGKYSHEFGRHENDLLSEIYQSVLIVTFLGRKYI